ncbi:unnamed protein product [Heterobilharzia americana]|nr:unnamed protein product [Heterobilharzia americana]
MSSKVKSEKTKVKFAQSNINHVYKGNTTETHHKPTVRQYGMQVVGKLQGTRRLPPPAWVPSIKAETGGLDSRVSLVPAGGGGWGAPPTSTCNTEQPTVPSPESDNVATVPKLPSVNGALYSETVGISLEPAYAKTAYGNSGPSITGPSITKADTSVGVNGPVKTSDTHQSVDEVQPKDKVPNQLLKSLNDKPSSGGGLAANKPFFQRPVPIVTTSCTATTISTKSESPSKPGSGAREIVGEPSGWVAIGQDEPDFDERIIFSDDEDCDEVKPARSVTSAHLTEHPAQFSMSPPPTAVKSNLHPIPMKPFVNPVTSLSADCAVQSHSTLPQKVYMEDSSMITSDPWSSANIYTVNSSASHPRPITQNLPYSMSSVNTHCGITPETNRLVPSSQFINHATSTGVMDSFYSTHPLQNRLTVPITNSVADSVRSATDVDSELQQAQRQARTQEFRNAVERAQQARARQRLSESCSADSDSMLSKSALGLLSTMPENRPISSVPSPFVTTACQAGPNYLFSMSDPSVSSVLNVPAHGLLPQAFPTSGPLDITTAIAAATAAAMAYTGGSDGGVPVRSGMEIPISVPTIIPHTQVPISVSSNTAAAGSWQAAFASGNSMPAALVRLLSQQPHMAQLLQNALNMSVGSSAQGVFPQINRSPGPPVSSSKSTSFSETNIQPPMSNLQQEQSPVNAADSGIRSNLKSTTQAFSNLDDSASQNMEFDGSSEKAHRVHKVSQLSIRPDAPTVATSATVTCSGSSAQRTSRVPGLMDIKVYCASSQHLAHLWDKEDNLLDTGNRAFRGRGRNLTSHKLQRSGTRGHGTARSHLLDSVTSDFKSMNLRDTDDRQYPLEDFDVSYRAQSMSKSSKPWSSKPSHSVDDTALDSYNASARTKSGFACDDHIGNRKQTRNIPDDNFWIRSDLDINSPFISSSEDDIDECGVLSDVQEAEATEEDKGYEQSINDLRKKVDPRLSKFSQPNQTAVADNQDRNRNSSTYNRRGRRGRVATGSHFTSSRSYTTDDFSSYSKRYSKGSEHDYYWRQQYVSSSRGFRAGQSTGSNTDQHKIAATMILFTNHLNAQAEVLRQEASPEIHLDI